MQKKSLNWTNIVFFVATTLISFIFTPLYFLSHPFSWSILLFFVALFSISNLVITVGYHRYFSHRSYDAHPVLEFLMAIVGAGALQGSILVWGTDHRRHHRAVDTGDDPYNINQGFWHAHMGWMIFKEDSKYSGKFAPDLAKNKIIMFQHNHYVALATLMGFVTPALLGWALGFGFWGGLLIGGVLRIVLTQHSTFFINSLCHTIGRRPYSENISARDSLIMAFLTFGEGYHNYHHQFQIDYRNGIKWYHWDPSKWSIKLFALLGLASRLRKVGASEILKARLQMDERRLLAVGACAETLANLKVKIEQAQLRMRQLKEECNVSSRDRYLQIKAELKTAQREFKFAYNQWLTYTRLLNHRAGRVS
jgi:stearoyl-CoA desaturase (delta-9 desaturase)